MRRFTAIVGLLVLILASCSTSSDPTATYTGGACDYDGPSEFDLNSTVTFTVTNESETTEVGFALWKFPEGVTPEEILAQGIFEFVTSGNAEAGVSHPTVIGEPETLRVFFDSPGQWGIVCFDASGGESDVAGIDYVTMFTVKG
jgi:hypothetical protein